VSLSTTTWTALLERDPGFLCAYCATPLAMPFSRTGTAEEDWQTAGWELALLPDGEPVWQLAEGRSPAHRDHVDPASKGGPDHLDNLVFSCEACNMDKRADSLLGFLARRSGCPRYRSVGGDHQQALARAWSAA
jgi:hypothetical protein